MSVHWKGPTNALVMQPNSPTLTYGDRVQAVDVYKGPQNMCAASMIPRGAFGTGFRSGWVCTKSSVTVERGLIGTLTIEWEAGGTYATQPLPTGSFSLDPQELYPKIERAKMFQGIGFDTLNICYNAILGGNSNGHPKITPANLSSRFPNPNNDPAISQQLSLAQKLLAKLQLGEDTFYLASWRYTYEVYSYTEPTPNQGGFVVMGSPAGPAPQLPGNVSWLRLADKIEPAGVNGSMYKTVLTFLGGPYLNGMGWWDTDIYKFD